MFSIFLWVLSSISDSAAVSFWKKSIDSSKSLSKTMFKYYSIFFTFLMVVIFHFTLSIEYSILFDYKYLVLWFIIIWIWIINTYLHLHILKTIKLSEILPYDNLDKLFTVIIWSILYHWTSNQTSTTTLLTTIFTIILILLFTIDFKNIKIPKSIGLFILHKLIKSISIISVWYILLKYTNITFAAINWVYEFIIFTFIAILLKDSFKSMITQSKEFYVSRFSAVILGWTWYMLGLYIIQTSWIIVATLLWFLSIVSSILSMKFILNDNPSKKQITLAFLIIILIWIWYYFK